MPETIQSRYILDKHFAGRIQSTRRRISCAKEQMLQALYSQKSWDKFFSIYEDNHEVRIALDVVVMTREEFAQLQEEIASKEAWKPIDKQF